MTLRCIVFHPVVACCTVVICRIISMVPLFPYTITQANQHAAMRSPRADVRPERRNPYCRKPCPRDTGNCSGFCMTRRAISLHVSDSCFLYRITSPSTRRDAFAMLWRAARSAHFFPAKPQRERRGELFGNFAWRVGRLWYILYSRVL